MFKHEALVHEMPNLRKFALRLTRNVHEAEDLVQSTLLRAIEKQALFEDNTNLFSWTSKIMFNLFVTGYRRKKKFESQYDPEPHIMASAVDAPQENMVDLALVRTAMQRLSKEHREMLVLVCIKGMRYEEVSEFLQIPVGTVRSRLSRARSALQQLMDHPFAEESMAVATVPLGRIQATRDAIMNAA
ncbi:MAG: sigma-70 family RNA polymerase sigma factor [Alphaproteobacteria bacterium]|nr:sigma-70 family RNA polymerase sigma factor [Alphaproteobacteria bacterium]